MERRAPARHRGNLGGGANGGFGHERLGSPSNRLPPANNHASCTAGQGPQHEPARLLALPHLRIHLRRPLPAGALPNLRRDARFFRPLGGRFAPLQRSVPSIRERLTARAKGAAQPPSPLVKAGAVRLCGRHKFYASFPALRTARTAPFFPGTPLTPISCQPDRSKANLNRLTTSRTFRKHCVATPVRAVSCAPLGRAGEKSGSRGFATTTRPFLFHLPQFGILEKHVKTCENGIDEARLAV